MVKKGTIIGLVFLFAFAKQASVFAQSNYNWPVLLPSYSNDFFQEDLAYSNTCFDNLFIDDSGRMWLDVCGLQRTINSIGLFSFDGYRFQPIELTKADGTLYTNIFIRGLSSDGRFYGIADDRFFVMAPQERQATLIPFADASYQDFTIRAIQEIDGTLYILSTQGNGPPQLFALQEGQFVHLASVEAYQGLWTSNWHPISGNAEELWLMGGNLPVFRYDLSNNTIDSFGRSAFMGELPVSKLTRDGIYSSPPVIRQLADGTVYLLLPSYYGSSLYHFDRKQQQFLPQKNAFPVNWTPVNIFQDQVGNICFLFQDKQNNYQAVIEDTSGQRFNYSAIVQGQADIANIVSQDFRRQSFIMGNGGLHVVDIQKRGAIEQALSGKWISSMAFLSEHQLLVNTVTDAWFLHDTLRQQTTPFAGTNCGIESSPFEKGMKQQILSDEQGQLWFISFDNLVEYDPVSGQCQAYSLPFRGQLFDFIRPNLILLQYNRTKLRLFDLQKREVLPIEDWMPSDTKGFVRDIFTDSRGKVWIPTNKGLWKLDFEQKRSQFITDPEGFQDFRFTAIYEDPRGRLWLGTYFGGLHIYDPETGTIQVIDQRKGLSNNSVMSIVADKDGDVWVGTEYGICILSPEGEVLNNIYQEDGLLVNKFERFDPFVATNGDLYFGCRQGINIIHPRQLKANLKNEEEVKIYLTDAVFYDQQAGQEISHQNNLRKLGTIELPPENPGLQLRFALSTYLEPARSHFVYRLEGKDDNWNYLGSQSELNISRLPPGKYNILIQGADFRNNWTTNNLTIPVHVRQFFYKQAWFYLLLALPFVLFAWLWIRNKQREAQRLAIKVAVQTQKIRTDKELIEQQAAELRELDQLKSNFFTNISHELRTPITLIKAPLENVLEQYGSQLARGLEGSLHLVLNNAQKLSRLVEELLELSRLDAKKITLKETATPLYTFCEQLFYSYSAAAKLKNIDYQFTARIEKDQHYFIDRNRLEKIINNLLSNALKFTSESGQINMHLYPEDEQFVIQVQDTGRGIPEEDLPHLFERYFQTRREDIATAGGTGIGLALSSELVNLMGGQIQVESSWGQGTTFWVRLPAKKASLEADQVVLSDNSLLSTATTTIFAKAETTENKLQTKILIVEDNPEMQVLLQSILNNHYECLIVDHGAAAWKLLEKEAPEVDDIDLILSDIMMPEMDGYTLLKKIKAHQRWQQLPVVMLTARSAEEDKLQALRMGVDDYLMKPFSPQELKARLQNLINNYRSRQPFKQAAIVNKGIDITFEAEASANQLWLEEVETAAKAALDKGLKLTTTILAEAVFLSSRQFARRLKALTGLSPTGYIQEVKLQKARTLLENQVFTTVEEVAAAAGYSSGSYLTKSFQERFGKKPGAYF